MKGYRHIALTTMAMIIIGVLLILIPSNLSNIRSRVSIEKEHYNSLLALEETAVQNGDYPIGALLVFGDSIIGRGFNTIRISNEPTGHAEINAIKDAFLSLGYSEFAKLNRDSLILLCSLEPCMMCKGTINYYDIRKIYFLNQKKRRYRLRYLRKDFSFYFKTRQIKIPEDQKIYRDQ